MYKGSMASSSRLYYKIKLRFYGLSSVLKCALLISIRADMLPRTYLFSLELVEQSEEGGCDAIIEPKRSLKFET